MKQILKDPVLDSKLSDEGFVLIPFLTDEEVNALKTFYFDYHESVLSGMYATAHVPDIDLRMKMNNFIKDQFSRAVNEKFINAHALGGSYIAKGKGEAGTLHPHQDWNIVDEELYRSFNIWVPLVDLHENNGAICIMPQSHLWDKTYRSANIPSIYQDQESDLWENMTKLYMKAGVALIYDHRLIHASGENKTDKLRLAAVFGIIPDEASMFYYHQKDSYTIEVYESNPDFFLLGNIFEGPKGLKKIDEFQYSQEILHKEKTYVVSQKKANLIDRIRALFK
jgi:hypothetical protein